MQLECTMTEGDIQFDWIDAYINRVGIDLLVIVDVPDRGTCIFSVGEDDVVYDTLIPDRKGKIRKKVNNEKG